MADRRTLRAVLNSDTFIRAIGVHDGLTAILAERGGFEAVWAGGFGISSAHGVPDAGLLTMSEFHADAVRIRRSTNLPIIADADAGFGDANVVRRMVALYESSGIDAVCIEDKQYPKRNSFRDGNALEDPEVFAGKLAAAKQAQSGPDFMLIARLESLICGAGMQDALERAQLYHAAGADAVLVHSRERGPAEVAEFCAAFRREYPRVPVLAVPTTYYGADRAELQRIGLSCAIYANQLIRAMVRASQELLSSLACVGSTLDMEGRIASISELFELVGTDRLIGDLPWKGLQTPTNVAGGAGHSNHPLEKRATS